MHGERTSSADSDRVGGQFGRQLRHGRVLRPRARAVRRAVTDAITATDPSTAAASGHPSTATTDPVLAIAIAGDLPVRAMVPVPGQLLNISDTRSSGGLRLNPMVLVVPEAILAQRADGGVSTLHSPHTLHARFGHRARR